MSQLEESQIAAQQIYNEWKIEICDRPQTYGTLMKTIEAAMERCRREIPVIIVRMSVLQKFNEMHARLSEFNVDQDVDIEEVFGAEPGSTSPLTIEAVCGFCHRGIPSHEPKEQHPGFGTLCADCAIRLNS